MEEEITLDLRELFGILRKRIKLILAITLLATMISAIISFFVLTPVYESKMSVIIGKQTTAGKVEDYTYSDVTMYQKLVKTYAVIAESKNVAEKALKWGAFDLEVNELVSKIKVSPQSDTQIMDISIQSTDPEEAKELVSAVTVAFIERAKEVIPNGSVEILDEAKVPKNPISPNKKLNVAIAFFLGLMVSVGIVFVLEYLDNTVKTKEDIQKLLDIPVIGVIPEHAAE
ncbi:YveK family protein [Clostridium sp. DL1XJH146]